MNDPRVRRAELIAYLARVDPPELATFHPETTRFVEGLSRFGRPVLVRAALEACKLALPVWEARHASYDEPRRTVHALQAWLACPCDACSARAAQLAFPFGDVDQRPLGPWRLPNGDPVDAAEENALDACSAAALAPGERGIGELVVSAISGAAKSLAPDAPDGRSVRERIWRALSAWAETAPWPQPGEHAGPSPLARMRAIERDVVQPAFAEVCASSSLRNRGLHVTHETGYPSRERARKIYTQLWASTRRVSEVTAADAWLDPDPYVGSTLVIEELDGIGRGAHPLAGVMLVVLVYDLRDGAVTACTKTTHFMMFDRALHTMERRFTGLPPGDVTRVELVQHVLDALTFFAVHAMSLTSPFVEA